MGDAEEMKKKLQELHQIPNEDSRTNDLLLLKEMQRKVEWTRPSPKKDHYIVGRFKKANFLRRFGTIVSETGDSATQFGSAEGAFHTPSTELALTTGFQHFRFLMALIDFFRIPLIYITAWQLGQKIPATPTRNLRFLYASIFLILAIVALVFPVTAPFIAIATAAVGMTVSIFSLSRFYQYRQRYKKELQQIDELLPQKEKEFVWIQNRAFELEKKQNAQVEIDALKIKYDEFKEEIQSLYNKKTILERKLERKNSTMMWIKTAGVGLSALGLIGITLSLFFPVIGLGIVLGSAGAGLLIFTVRMVGPSLVNLFSRIGNWFNKDESKTLIEESSKSQLQHSAEHDSTQEIIEVLDSQKKPGSANLKANESSSSGFELLEKAFLRSSHGMTKQQKTVEPENNEEDETEEKDGPPPL